MARQNIHLNLGCFLDAVAQLFLPQCSGMLIVAAYTASKRGCNEGIK
ncbi:hypothetical protein [Rosenbergiella nectarea]|nr:hypothetical protein [Rosenbergiella nectarea]